MKHLTTLFILFFIAGLGNLFVDSNSDAYIIISSVILTTFQFYLPYVFFLYFPLISDGIMQEYYGVFYFFFLCLLFVVLFCFSSIALSLDVIKNLFHNNNCYCTWYYYVIIMLTVFSSFVGILHSRIFIANKPYIK